MSRQTNRMMQISRSTKRLLIVTAIGIVAVIGTTITQYCIYRHPMSSTTAQEIAALRIEPININTATAEELTPLPDISPRLAEKIIRYREAHGRFETIEDLQKVNGVSPTVFQQIEIYITVE